MATYNIVAVEAGNKNEYTVEAFTIPDAIVDLWNAHHVTSRDIVSVTRIDNTPIGSSK